MVRTIALVCTAIGLLSAATAAEHPTVPIVRAGKAAAIVVTADELTAVVQYAASEIVYHLERATGVKPAILAESKAGPAAGARIYLGNCRAAKAAGIDVQELEPGDVRAADSEEPELYP